MALVDRRARWVALTLRAALFPPRCALCGALEIGDGIGCAEPPAVLDGGVLECARDFCGSIGPAFYGLRTSIVALLLMALLRIRRPEALEERCPNDLGRVLGLDRAPEVKTLRGELAHLRLATEPPPLAPARAPPELVFAE